MLLVAVVISTLRVKILWYSKVKLVSMNGQVFPENENFQFKNIHSGLIFLFVNFFFFSFLIKMFISFCVEVLWPSQPNGVMSSTVSLPNHMFTGQA